MNQKKSEVFTPLNAKAIKVLCKETKETMLIETQARKFSVVDLWAIQKSRKTAAFRHTNAV